MIRHWKKEKGDNFLKPALANILGAIICYAIVLILLFFRLSDIWPFFPIILILTLLFLAIHSHYQKWPNNCDSMKASKNVPTMAI